MIFIASKYQSIGAISKDVYRHSQAFCQLANSFWPPPFEVLLDQMLVYAKGCKPTVHKLNLGHGDSIQLPGLSGGHWKGHGCHRIWDPLALLAIATGNKFGSLPLFLDPFPSTLHFYCQTPYHPQTHYCWTPSTVSRLVAAATIMVTVATPCTMLDPACEKPCGSNQSRAPGEFNTSELRYSLYCTTGSNLSCHVHSGVSLDLKVLFQLSIISELIIWGLFPYVHMEGACHYLWIMVHL